MIIGSAVALGKALARRSADDDHINAALTAPLGEAYEAREATLSWKRKADQYEAELKALRSADDGKYRAGFLWPYAGGGADEAAYEFANAATEEYRKEWLAELKARIARSAADGAVVVEGWMRSFSESPTDPGFYVHTVFPSEFHDPVTVTIRRRAGDGEE
jgi:hypothetical protein